MEKSIVGRSAKWARIVVVVSIFFDCVWIAGSDSSLVEMFLLCAKLVVVFGVWFRQIEELFFFLQNSDKKFCGGMLLCRKSRKNP